MKKITSHRYLLNILCIFSLLTLSIMLLRNRPASNIIILTDGQSRQALTNSVITDDGKININLASAEDLTQIPGIGETLSQRIVQHRDSNGYFNDIDELKNIKGIGPKNLKKIKNYISTGD